VFSCCQEWMLEAVSRGPELGGKGMLDVGNRYRTMNIDDITVDTGLCVCVKQQSRKV
jgi:hypothetical protein